DLLVAPEAGTLLAIDLVSEAWAAQGAGATRPLQTELLRRLEDEVLRDARRSLPEYMVPSQLVRLERFPLHTHGKPDRHALPPPRFEAPADAQVQDEAQGAIAAAMAEVLALPKPPGPQGDFFKLGGHSLAAVRLASRLRERFGTLFDLQAVFKLRTV